MGNSSSLNEAFFQAKRYSEIHPKAWKLLPGDLILLKKESKTLLVTRGLQHDCYLVVEGSTKKSYLAAENIGKDWKIFREGKELK